MLPKALTSHSRMSGYRWVITPSWLSGSWRSFLCSSFVYSCYLFLISSVSIRSISFLSFIVPIFAWTIPLVSLIFLKRSLIFPILLFVIVGSYFPEIKCGHMSCFDQWNRVKVICVTSWEKHLRAGLDLPSWSFTALPMWMFPVIQRCHRMKVMHDV